MSDTRLELRSEDKLRARAEAVRRQHAAAVRRQKTEGNAKTLGLIVLSGLVAWTVYNNNRLAEKAAGRETLYAVLQPNGEFIASTHYTDVTPAAVQDDNVRGALWTYVQARDCYGSSSFIRQAYIAQAMSDDRVGRQIATQLALTNPLAPQHIYGEKGITVQCELVDPPTPIGENNNQYLFRFRRWEDNGKISAADIAAAPFFTVTVRYRLGVYPDNDKRRAWLDRTTFNAPGVQVIDYPGAKPDNAQPARRPIVGVRAEARP